MTGDAEGWLAAELRRGELQIGEVVVRRNREGKFVVHHFECDAKTAARQSTEAAMARVFARTDATGGYRPLKAAPNLARDWVLVLSDVREVRLALDFLYPAALGLWLAHLEGRLFPVNFCTTAARQSGMYRVVGRAAPELVDAVSQRTCASEGKCLRTILWEIKPGRRPAGHPRSKFETSADQLTGQARKDGVLPILCAECCNFFVAACRAALKEAGTDTLEGGGEGAGR